MSEHDVMQEILAREINELYDNVMQARQETLDALPKSHVFRRFKLLLLPCGQIIKQFHRRLPPADADGRLALIVLLYGPRSRNLSCGATLSPAHVNALACPPADILKTQRWIWMLLGNYERMG
jgi:hypothetical protein